MSLSGKLYIVATPIGNLDDMTPRAVQTLKAVDYIAAEDTRHSAKLLNHFAIRTPVVSYHEHNEEAQSGRILRWLGEGKDVSLISDAGTPLVSDPGYRLVRACHEAGHRVVPIPGVSALICGLSVAGLPTDHFYFEGFLPARSAARRKRLRYLRERPESLIIYESCHRITESLEDMVVELGGERRVAFCRELTKTFETVRQLSLEQLLGWVVGDENQQRGEVALVVAGCADTEPVLDDQTRHWLSALVEELPPSRVAAIGARVTGVKKKLLYEWLLQREDFRR